MNSSRYTGRFAPSPSGPLHFGSLIAALASYLDARACGGRWLVRIDDIDPPREQPGAAEQILQTLREHGLHWDGQVLWQSSRTRAYLQLLEKLRQLDLIYPCRCTRRDIKAMGGVYDGRCRRRSTDADADTCAWRLKLYDLPQPLAALPHELVFTDLLQGEQRQDLAREVGDAVVRRKDGLFGYQLAVVADDIAQGVTHIVRGSDLMPVTARQIRFFEILGERPPTYAHVPVAAGPDGRKLSKQNHAPALDRHNSGQNLWQALAFLRQNPPLSLQSAPCAEILAWALAHWRREPLVGVATSQPVEGL